MTDPTTRYPLTDDPGTDPLAVPPPAPTTDVSDAASDAASDAVADAPAPEQAVEGPLAHAAPGERQLEASLGRSHGVDHPGGAELPRERGAGP